MQAPIVTLVDVPHIVYPKVPRSSILVKKSRCLAYLVQNKGN